MSNLLLWYVSRNIAEQRAASVALLEGLGNDSGGS
jgi:hypothetical protein